MSIFGLNVTFTRAALAWHVGLGLLAFGAVANLFVLGLGALVPITVPGGDGVKDGGALLRYWREGRAGRRLKRHHHKPKP